MAPNTPLEALLASPIFAGVDASAIEALAALAREDRCGPGELIVQRGEPPERIRCVAQGAIEVGLFSRSGRPGFLAPLTPGQWTAWIACYLDEPFPHDLWSGPETVLFSWPVAAVRDFAEANPIIYPRLIRMIGHRIRGLVAWSLVNHIGDPEQQAAFALGTFCHDLAPDQDGPLTLNVTHERLASVGLGSRQRVARLLAALEAKGLITTAYGQIVILSRTRLSAFARA